MCLAYPAEVVEIKDMLATVELEGVRRKVSLMLLPETKLGDYVLVHAGFAMQIVAKQTVDEMMASLREIDDAIHENFSNERVLTFAPGENQGKNP